MTASDVTRQALIDAAFAEIERVGLANVTVRGLADAAKANIAAVNYHFGSKDQLLAAVMQSSIEHMVGDCEVILAKLTREQPEAALFELYTYLFEGMRRYPKLSRAHLHAPFTNDDVSGPFPTLFLPVLEKLVGHLRRVRPALSLQTCRRRVVDAISAIMFPVLFDELLAPLHALDSPQARKTWLEELTARTLS